MTFAERIKQITEEAAQSRRTTFNAKGFENLMSDLMNEPDYKVMVATTQKGEYSEKETYPVAALRKALIGSILKDAGHDAAEQAKYIENYQFPENLPWHPVVSEAIEAYMGCGKSFAFQSKKDMRATISITAQPEEVKEVKAPKTNESSKKRYGSYRKVKVKSNCPPNLKETID